MSLFLILMLTHLINVSRAADEVELTEFEEELFDELNLARTNPKAYADIIRDHLATFINENQFRSPEGTLFGTNEGKKAVREAIAALEIQAPIEEELVLSKGLSLGARDHVREQGPTGRTGHNSANGDGPSDRVSRYGSWIRTMGENISYSSQSARGHMIALLVDDGVGDRGHRVSLYNRSFKKAGLSCGDHKKYKTMCVIDLAGDFRNKETSTGGAVLLDQFFAIRP